MTALAREEARMSDRKGDPGKQPEGCKDPLACPNLIETSSATDFEGETYDCKVCGEHYRLYYEDMQ